MARNTVGPSTQEQDVERLHDIVWDVGGTAVREIKSHYNSLPGAACFYAASDYVQIAIEFKKVAGEIIDNVYKRVMGVLNSGSAVHVEFCKFIDWTMSPDDVRTAVIDAVYDSLEVPRTAFDGLVDRLMSFGGGAGAFYQLIILDEFLGDDHANMNKRMLPDPTRVDQILEFLENDPGDGSVSMRDLPKDAKKELISESAEVLQKINEEFLTKSVLDRIYRHENERPLSTLRDLNFKIGLFVLEALRGLIDVRQVTPDDFYRRIIAKAANDFDDCGDGDDDLFE